MGGLGKWANSCGAGKTIQKRELSSLARLKHFGPVCAVANDVRTMRGRGIECSVVSFSTLESGNSKRNPPMKSRIAAPALVALSLLFLSSGSANAGLFSGGCGCEPACGAPAVIWGTCCAPTPSWCDCSPCGSSCRPGLGLLKGLFSRCHSSSCCEVEASCGCEVVSDCGCSAAPSCGCDAAPCCGPKRGLGLFKKLFSKRSCGSCYSAPSCGCEPSCGVSYEPSCGCN